MYNECVFIIAGEFNTLAEVGVCGRNRERSGQVSLRPARQLDSHLRRERESRKFASFGK